MSSLASELINSFLQVSENRFFSRRMNAKSSENRRNGCFSYKYRITPNLFISKLLFDAFLPFPQTRVKQHFPGETRTCSVTLPEVEINL